MPKPEGKKLSKTQVFRGGRTAKQNRCEQTVCKASFDPPTNSLQISFTIDAKGGGKTDLVVKIGDEDIPMLISMLADHRYDLGPTFLEAANRCMNKSIKMVELATDDDMDDWMRLVTNYIEQRSMVEPDRTGVREAVVGAAARLRELSGIADKAINNQKSAQ